MHGGTKHKKTLSQRLSLNFQGQYNRQLRNHYYKERIKDSRQGFTLLIHFMPAIDKYLLEYTPQS